MTPKVRSRTRCEGSPLGLVAGRSFLSELPETEEFRSSLVRPSTGSRRHWKCHARRWSQRRCWSDTNANSAPDFLVQQAELNGFGNVVGGDAFAGGQIVGSYSNPAHTNVDRGFIYDRGAVTPVDFVLSEEFAPPSFPPEPFDWGDLGSGTVTYVRTLQFTAVTGINDRGDIIGRAGSLYTPMVECGGCGLTTDDFFFLVYFDFFTGERDGSRNVHVRNARRHELQRILVPHGKARGVQSLIRGRKP